VLGLTGILRTPAATVQSAPVGVSITYLRFVGFTLVNPFTILYFASIVAGGGITVTALPAGAFLVGVLLASVSWQSALALAGAALGRLLLRRARVVFGAIGYSIVLALAARQFYRA